MTATIVALLASVVVAGLVFIATGLVHSASTSPRMRRRIRRWRAEVRWWSEDVADAAVRALLRVRRALVTTRDP